MVYLMHPVNQVQPVLVTADASVEALVDGLDALGLFTDDALDAEWLTEDQTIADGGRLECALNRYEDLHSTDGIGPALERSRCAAGTRQELDQFFAFLAGTGGQALLIQRLT